MDNNKANENENKNDKEDFSLYANPYADLDFKKNEIINSNNNSNNNNNKNKNNDEKNNQNNNTKIKNSHSNNNKNIENNFNNKNNDNINNNKNSSNKNIINNNINNNTNIYNNNNNINSIHNNFMRSKTVNNQKKLYTIKETGSHLYIENTKKITIIAIEKSFNKIYQVKDFSEMLSLNQIKLYQVDSISGIIDINGNNKYFLVLSSSQLIGHVIRAVIYNILDVDLIQITLFNEYENEKNRINGVKTLFQSKNFYYSNEVDLSSSLF